MMKRILAGLMILMMAVTCFSCKRKEDSNASFGGTTYEDQPDEVINTNPDVTDEEQSEEEGETPSTDAPTEEEPNTEDQTKVPVEEPSEDEKQEEEQTPAEDEKQEDEQTPEEDKTPGEEQDPEENTETPTYPGEAVTFTAESIKIAYHGLYNDVEDLMMETVGGETLLLLNSSEGVESFNAQISAWMDTSSRGEEETEEDYEEVLLFDLESETGRAYNSTYFTNNSLLLLCVSGTVGAVKAVTVEGTQLNIYIESVAGTGTGVLGDMSTSIVALEVASASIVDCTAYKIHTI